MLSSHPIYSHSLMGQRLDQTELKVRVTKPPIGNFSRYTQFV